MAYGALLMLILALALPNRKKQAEGLTAGSDSQAKLEAALMG